MNQQVIGQENATDRSFDGLYSDLERNSWAGGNILRGEIPRMVVVTELPTATVERRNQVLVLAGGTAVSDVPYICIKNSSDAYEWRVLGVVQSSSTTELKSAMVAAGILAADGGVTNLNLDGGDLTADDITADDITADVVFTDTINPTPSAAVTVAGGLTVSGAINFTGILDGGTTSDLFIRDAYVEGALRHEGSTLGYFGTAATTKRTVTGSQGGNAALISLIDALAAYGLITDSAS